MNIAITGSDGFLGKNLQYSLCNQNKNKVFCINKSTGEEELKKILTKCEIVFHFAGVNRPKNQKDFFEQNINFTKKICDLLIKHKKKPKIIFASTSHVKNKNLYGSSKLKSEDILKKFFLKNKSNLFIFRLPNVFGKWSKPNYNSAVSTFCFNIAREKKIFISDKNKNIDLVYIDDVIKKFLEIINGKIKNKNKIYYKINSVHKISLGNLVNLIKKFKINRPKLFVENHITNFSSNLYSTYVSFLPKKNFKYRLKSHADNRGEFFEFLKTSNNGQVSIFTIKKNKTRGNHFHHSKVEKFLLLSGKVEFYMSDLGSNNSIKIKLDEKRREVIESIPGWFHNIKNIGKKEAIILLWSNQVFDDKKPDTFFYEKKN
jgi:UDP-2-acetamido-2,6-beta-L-arabino-hexul-4-ose reductase